MNFDIALKILGAGIFGFGFLVAYLAYNLLKREGQKPKPSESVLRATDIFMAFVLIMCVVGGGFECYKQTKTTQDCANQLASVNADRDKREAALKTQIAEVTASFNAQLAAAATKALAQEDRFKWADAQLYKYRAEYEHVQLSVTFAKETMTKVADEVKGVLVIGPGLARIILNAAELVKFNKVTEDDPPRGP